MKNDILKKDNIILGLEGISSEEVINNMGDLLFKSGYVKKEYTQNMLDREKVFVTNIGNGIAMPHGTEEGRKNILRSGIGIMVFPNGTLWKDEVVKVVIGVAGTGEDHMDILMRIAELLAEPEDVERLVDSDQDTIYEMFAGNK